LSKRCHILGRFPALCRIDRHRGPSRAGGRPLRALLFDAAVIALLGLAVGACTAERSYERTADGSIMYIDELSEAERVRARDRIAQTLIRGYDVYELQLGDEVEIFFHVIRQPTSGPYVISVADKLRIEFLNEATDNNRVVEVRPDGHISVPLIGPVMAAGKTADDLARDLERRYTALMIKPQITVNVTESHSPLADFLLAVGPTGKTRSIKVKVSPDGTIYVPVIGPVPARGRTLRDVTREIDAAFAARRLDVTASVVPDTLHVGTTLVFGEVGKPGKIESDRPLTVLMTVAQAGGVLPTGSLDNVRVFYLGSEGLPHVRLVNLKSVLDDLRLEQDMVVPPNSVVYVPPTMLAKTGRLMDAVLRDILRYQGFNISGSFLMNNPTGGGTTVIPTTTGR
jgi:protein involved in polysaccharide export with SLBB domain